MKSDPDFGRLVVRCSRSGWPRGGRVCGGGLGREWNGDTQYFCKKDAKTLVLI
jgi:hypothetical protein